MNQLTRFDIITIFPDFFREVFDYGIIRRARAAGLVDIKAHDLRGWTSDKPFQHIGILSLEFHVDKLSRPLL